MIQKLLRDIVRITSRIGFDPLDNEELRFQKALLVAASLMFILAGTIWGMLYLALAQPVAASVPLSYAVLSAVSILVFARVKRYDLFRHVQLFWMLVLPFLLMLALGGFVNSSAVVLWSLVVPLGALIFDEPRHAPRWFLAFLALVVLGALLQPFLPTAHILPLPIVLMFFVMNVGGVATAAFVLLYFFMNQRNLAFRLLRAEQQKSESLLLNILPKEIAATLKNQTGTVAQHYDCVSVLFADIVNFTPWSVELEPKEMVGMLNELFSYFDSLLDNYGVEKIRTIGDNYMAAAGVPTPRPDHAQALARMALDMCAYINSRPPRNGKRLDFRIGINSGPAVAGVIGSKKFQYDLWGDPVNTASRMESHGVPGKIQITRATFDLIKDEFICEPRGKVMVKGKGEMETWFLVGIKADETLTVGITTETGALERAAVR